MTTPTIGHGDYQHYAQWRSPIFDSGLKNVTTATPYVIHEDIPNWASVYLRINETSITGDTVTLSWWTDATETVQIDTDKWILSAGFPTLSVLVPGKSNHFSLTISTVSAGTRTVEVFIAPTNIVTPAIRYPSTGNVIEGFNQNINANSGALTPLPQVMEGEGWVFVNVAGHATGFNMAVNELNEQGNAVGVLAQQFSTGPPINQSFLATPRGLQLSVNNTDAAAHNFDFTILVLGR